MTEAEKAQVMRSADRRLFAQRYYIRQQVRDLLASIPTNDQGLIGFAEYQRYPRHPLLCVSWR